MPSSKDHVVRCRWMTPTIFLDAPHWVEADRCPWSCARDVVPRPLATTEECATCKRFEPAPPYPAVRHLEWPDVFR